ncbi:hypothetical protein SB749_18980, partial [Brevibacterium sp. SIMBA_078]|uniref:hypothetical protein n=1 Tax=Brevibacterium sp. SIMBA_078 TaxID=3085816 RepID=UPI00397E2369
MWHSDFGVILADGLLFLAGICIGILIFLFDSVNFLTKIYISPHTKGTKMNVIKMQDEETGEEILYVNPETFKQT